MPEEPAKEDLCPACGKPLPAFAPQGLCPQCLLGEGLDDSELTLPLDPANPGPSGKSNSQSRSPAPPVSPPDSSSGFHFQAPSVETLDALLRRYDVTAQIGRGGMGAVYLGTQKRLNRKVAIKVLPANVGTELQFAERFEREAQSMAALQHPNIVAVHDFGETTTDDGTELLYFVMEFVDGTDLHRLIRSGQLTPEKAMQLVPQICSALQFAHDHGIVHRDIKPANILINQKGQVKVADFGLAKMIGLDSDGGDVEGGGLLTMTAVSMGTPGYVAPETLEQGSREADHRADIYALGVMLYEMLTGKVPFGAFELPSKSSPDLTIDPRLDEVVSRAMQADREARYQQASEISGAIESITSGEVAAPAASGGGGAAGAGRKRGLLAVAGLAILAVIGGGYFLWSGRVAGEAETSSQAVVKSENGPKDKTEVITIERPGIDLPPALAAMRERGGRLRGWSPDQPDKITERVEQASGLDDLVRLKSSSGGIWVALRRGGNLEHIHTKGQRRESVDQVAAFAVSNDLSFAYCTTDGKLYGKRLGEIEELSPGPFVDLSVGHSHAYGIRADGSTELIPLKDDIESTPGFASVNDFLRGKRNILWITTDVQHSLAYTRSGEILRWVFNSGHRYSPEEFPGAVEAVFTDAGVLVLEQSGGVHYLADDTEPTYSIPEDLPPVFAIRYGAGVVAAQTADGSWVTWGDESNGLARKIEEIGPAADIRFGQWEDFTHFYWIEPADADLGEPAITEAPTIELPPALAAMKERGGRLRGWGKTPDGEDISEAFPLPGQIDDFVQVSAVTNGNWQALRSNGKAEGGRFGNLTGIVDFNVAPNGWASAVLQDGTVIVVDNNSKKIDVPLTDVTFASVGKEHGYFGRSSGEAALIGWTEEVRSTRYWAKVEKLLSGRRDIVEIDTFLGGWSIARTGNGETLTWSLHSTTPSPPEGIGRAVDVAAWQNCFLVLDDAGKVTPVGQANFGLSDVPADLPPAVAIRVGYGGAAAQLRDGTWRAWGEASPEMVSKINELGPAVDLVFTQNFVYWIEPADESKPEQAVTKTPTITLPPALAAMKERGGRLRGWGTVRSGEDISRFFDVERAREFDDFIEIGVLGNGGWIALRSRGTTEAFYSEFRHKENVRSVHVRESYAALVHHDSTTSFVNQNYAAGKFGPPATASLSGISTAKGYVMNAQFFLNDSGGVQWIEWGPFLADSRWWKDWKEFLEGRSDLADFDANGHALVALTRSGEVFSGLLDHKSHGLKSTDVADGLIDVEAGDRFFLGRDRNGNVHCWGDSDEILQVPPDLPPAVQIKGRSRVAAAQLEDGSWVAWGDNSRGVVDQINAIGPAIDIEFYMDLDQPDIGYVYWIESADAASTRAASGAAKIKLSPALAAMKERGGRLRAWNLDPGHRTSLDISAVADVDDFVTAHVGGPDGDYWRATRRTGERRSSFREQDGRTDWADTGLGIVVKENGDVEPTAGSTQFRPLLESIPEVQAVEVTAGWHEGMGWQVVRTRDGRLYPVVLPEKKLPSWDRVEERLRALDQVVALDSSLSSGMALLANGEPVCWCLTGKDPFVPVPEEVENVAMIACGQENFLALSADGKVWNWDERGKLVASLPGFEKRVVAIRANRASEPGAAAQLEDGTWVAWGIPDGEEYERRIAAIGPALDLSFDVEVRADRARLLWIEPTEAPFTSDPVAATKEKPFENSLRMRFVPVPITGGPSEGDTILFSVWETRVRDYEAFIEAEGDKREWLKPDFEQEDDHPAVNVSWEDATAFCEWLTREERKKGRLGEKEIYRLPTDHEWSCAVGIGKEEDPDLTPEAKSGKLSADYSWGKEWPPPKGSGNFRGEETASNPVGAGKVIGGYDDGYERTAPVGSFPLEHHGIRDLGGNVREWCQDWYSSDRTHRVLRGGSWRGDFEAGLRSSYRSFNAPSFRFDNNGFRVVVEVDAVARPGRLRVEGPLTDAAPNDLSAAEGIEDFTQVIVAGGWIGLRENGETVSSLPEADGKRGVRRLLAGPDRSYGWIDNAGRLTIEGEKNEASPGVRAVPAAVQEGGVVDACWLDGAALALLRDGTASVWGEHYEGSYRGSPIWSRPEPRALENVRDIAATKGGGNYRFATLTAEGELHNWGNFEDVAGPFDLETIRELGPFSAIESGWAAIRLLDQTGNVSNLAASRDMRATGGIVATSAARISGRFVQPAGSERWDWVVDRENVSRFPALDGLEPGHFAVRTSGNEKVVEATIWIEPVTPRPPSTHQPDRQRVPVGLAPAHGDGADDGKDDVEDDEKEQRGDRDDQADDGEGDGKGDDGIDRHRDLEVEALEGLAADELALLALEQPDDERSEDVSHGDAHPADDGGEVRPDRPEPLLGFGKAAPREGRGTRKRGQAKKGSGDKY